MPDVIDFLVLRQFYDEARQRNWQPCKSVLIELYIVLKTIDLLLDVALLIIVYTNTFLKHISDL